MSRKIATVCLWLLFSGSASGQLDVEEQTKYFRGYIDGIDAGIHAIQVMDTKEGRSAPSATTTWWSPGHPAAARTMPPFWPQWRSTWCPTQRTSPRQQSHISVSGSGSARVPWLPGSLGLPSFNMTFGAMPSTRQVAWSLTAYPAESRSDLPPTLW